MLKGGLRPLRQGRQDQILSAGPASRGSQTPALPKGRARQGVPEDRLQGRLDGPQDGWSGWRLVLLASGWRVWTAPRPRIPPPAPLALRDWTLPEGNWGVLMMNNALYAEPSQTVSGTVKVGGRTVLLLKAE